MNFPKCVFLFYCCNFGSVISTSFSSYCENCSSDVLYCNCRPRLIGVVNLGSTVLMFHPWLSCGLCTELIFSFPENHLDRRLKRNRTYLVLPYNCILIWKFLSAVATATPVGGNLGTSQVSVSAGPPGSLLAGGSIIVPSVGTTESRPLYPRPQYSMSRVHVTIDPSGTSYDLRT